MCEPTTIALGAAALAGGAVLSSAMAPKTPSVAPTAPVQPPTKQGEKAPDADQLRRKNGGNLIDTGPGASSGSTLLTGPGGIDSERAQPEQEHAAGGLTMCMAPSMPGTGNTFWTTGAAGMTPEEQQALPSLTPEAITWGGISTVAQLSQERTAALDKWKAENPERYQEGLREQERQAAGQAPRTQAATDARRGAGGSGGGAGASSTNTLLTGRGESQGVDPSALDLSKSTLLGL